MHTHATKRIDPLTVSEVAEELRVTPLTVYRAIDRGELRALRLGASGRLRVPRSALEAFLRPTNREGYDDVA